MNPRVFRAYDVRGVADRDLDDAFVADLGRAYGTRIARDGGRRVCLGRDCRLHGERLRVAFLEGLLSTGLQVIDVGVVASPMLYFAVHHHDADGGVQITGSHNPPEYNGFKMMRGKGSLHGDAIQDLRRAIEVRDFDAAGGGAAREEPIFEAYVSEVVDRLSLGPRRLKVVVDGGNGTGGPPAVDVLERLGVEVIGLHIPMDGRFPNHHPDPTVEENLVDVIEAVRTHGADLGLAFDGDADRIGVVDDRGEVVWGDRLMILLARELLAVEPGAAIVGEVKCSKTLFDDIAAHGGRPIMAQVGHSLIKARMKQEGALLAGEMSGHIFYAHRWYGFDDAVYTAGRLVEILSHRDRPLSELFEGVPETVVTPEIRLACSDDLKFDLVAEAVRKWSETHEVVAIDGARIDFGDGWGLIRASNTQPVVVLRAEAGSASRLAEIRGALEAFVHARTGTPTPEESGP